MKILQINTIYGSKSTGRTCKELEQYLVANGHECVTAFGHGAKGAPNTYRINTRFEYLIHNVLSRITGLEGYFSAMATRRLLRFMDKYQPDVVHLRNLHGHYLNLPMLFRYLKKKQLPVVMHLHDCWILTGKCTHPTGFQCDGWLSSCKNCPAKKQYPQSYFFDFSRKMFRDKKKWFAGLARVQVVGVSDWVAGEGKRSYLGSYPVSRIYNWINTDVFRPRKSDVLARYDLPAGKFNVVCVGAAWNTGSSRYRDLMTLADQLDPNMQIIVVGSAAQCKSTENVKFVGFTENTVELAELYSAADVYVHFSVADTFGKVIAEAMACGIPAVVYDTTACPEIVGGDCGFVVPLHDTNAIVQCLREIQSRGREQYATRCAERVQREFGYKENCAQTVCLYENILK